VESYTTLNWDIRKAYDTVVQLYELFRGGPGTWDGQVLLPISNRLGIDLERDLIPVLSGRITWLSWIEKPATLNSQSTLVAFRLTNPDVMQTTLATAMGRLSAQFTSRAYAGASYYAAPVQRGRRPDLGEGAWREEVACIAVLDDYLFVTNSEKLLQKVITARRDPSDKLADALDFKIIASRIQRQLNEQQAALIAFSRPEESLRQVYDLAQSPELRSQLLARGESIPLLKSVGGALEQHRLPPFSVIAQYLSPRGALVTDDETGIHYLAFTLRRD